MWDVTVPVAGRCRDCGDELETEITVRATQEWVDRYASDDLLRERIDAAIVRLVASRHARQCLGQAQRRPALAAASA